MGEEPEEDSTKMNDLWLQVLRQMTQGRDANADISRDVLQQFQEKQIEEQEAMRVNSLLEELRNIDSLPDASERQMQREMFKQRIIEDRERKLNSPVNRQKGLLA
jgi:hypothetical protein